MSTKPIFLATHPRSCSTAFERVFMTRHDTLKCVHEPFGDAFYYGPERLSSRFEDNQSERTQSGFANSTFQAVFDRLERDASEGKRLFIKDIIHYLVPPDGAPASIAPSLKRKTGGIETSKEASVLEEDMLERANPTVVPHDKLKKFHFTFLIRHPRYSVPSYFRCTVPPLDEKTGFYNFMPSEAGYDELRRVFDYLCSLGQTGPNIVGQKTNQAKNGATESDSGLQEDSMIDICLIDADDLLDDPSRVIEAYCKSVGLQFDERMLNWEGEENHKNAKEAFAKWYGFHEDAINSTGLRKREHKRKPKTKGEEDAQWCDRYGDKGAKIIRETVEANLGHYNYLRQYRLVV